MAEAEAATAWIDDPAFAGHGGESFDMLAGRIAAWLAARRTIEGVVLAITHAAVLRAAAIAVLGAPTAAFWRIDAGPLSALTLSSDGRRWVLRELRQL
jgi:broad specificity phosphatase PhoE